MPRRLRDIVGGDPGQRLLRVAAGQNELGERGLVEYGNPLAACLMLAPDRLDTLTGLFAIGLAPTGAKDPFAQRRAAIGLVQNLIAWKLDFDLREGIALAAVKQPVAVSHEAQSAALDFIVGRLRAHFTELVRGEDKELYEQRMAEICRAEMARRGYATFPEPGRQVVKEEAHVGGDAGALREFEGQQAGAQRVLERLARAEVGRQRERGDELRESERRGLRVVDASIIPETPVSAMNAPSMLIGLRGSKLILEDDA